MRRTSAVAAPYNLPGRIVPVREGGDPRHSGPSCRRVILQDGLLPPCPAAARGRPGRCRGENEPTEIRTAGAFVDAPGGLWGLSLGGPCRSALGSASVERCLLAALRGITPGGSGRCHNAPEGLAVRQWACGLCGSCLPWHSCAPGRGCVASALFGGRPGRSCGRHRATARRVRTGAPPCSDRLRGAAASACLAGSSIAILGYRGGIGSLGGTVNICRQDVKCC